MYCVQAKNSWDDLPSFNPWMCPWSRTTYHMYLREASLMLSLAASLPNHYLQHPHKSRLPLWILPWWMTAWAFGAPETPCRQHRLWSSPECQSTIPRMHHVSKSDRVSFLATTPTSVRQTVSSSLWVLCRTRSCRSQWTGEICWQTIQVNIDHVWGKHDESVLRYRGAKSIKKLPYLIFPGYCW